MPNENQTTGAGSGHIEMPDDPVRPADGHIEMPEDYVGQADAATGQQGGSVWGDDEQVGSVWGDDEAGETPPRSLLSKRTLF